MALRESVSTSTDRPALRLWVEFFDDLQHVRGRSQNTVMAYRRDLELWEAYRAKNQSVSGFYQFMKEQGLSTRSQARVISSLRTYFRFCEAQGFTAPELKELRPPKVKAGLPKPLMPAEFDQLLAAAESVEDPIRRGRNRLTLYLLYGLGCRVSELCGLNLRDFHDTDAWLSILGKGDKERAVPLTQGLADELRTYLQRIRPELVRKTGEAEALLLNDRGHRPSRVDVWRWLASWSETAGFAETVHPHRFRHGCATALLESGADLRSIQILLGHASIQTTQIYTSVATPALVEAISHHPLASERQSKT
ncbi:MAG TPA: tyrosine-type recombinase/integrase [Pseudobdellovibrionaceae bacterium]|nr:tyrosine-type recombinase/integrase [Pseudobdellovibrionaceae bacterium]